MQIRKTKKGSSQPQIISGLQEKTTSASAEAFALLIFTTIAILFGMLCLYSVTYTYASKTIQSIGTAEPSSFFSKDTMEDMRYVFKQGIWVLIGVGGMCTIICLGYRKVAQFSTFAYLGLLVLLLLPITVMRHNINGAYRWLIIGPFQIQPSEFAKFILVFFWASFLAKRPVDISVRPYVRVLLPICILTTIPLLLILLGKDLGTTILLAYVFSLVIIVAGLPLWCGLFVPVGLVAAFFTLDVPFVRDLLTKIHLLPEYRLARLMSYRNPELYADKAGYQLWLSELALGSGGWSGLGFTKSRMKYNYLPEAHTDCIVSIIGEEMGFLMLMLLIAIYVAIGFCGYAIARKACSKLGVLLAFGMTTFILLQAFINIGVVCGALPTKGMPAPFISYGGSNMLTCLLAIGVIFSVAWENIKYSQGIPNNKPLEQN